MITLRIVPDDGTPYLVTATARDILVWEKTSKDKKSFQDLVRDPKLEDLYRVAHLASWRQGLYTGTLAEFEKSVEVEGVTDDDLEDDAPDPTQQGPSTGPASPSPSEPVLAPPRGQRKANAR